jgi:pyruvate dehydrogenase E1 component alpha subunit
VASYKDEKDPIERLRKLMIAEYGAKEGDFDAVEKEIKDIVSDAAQFATECPEPDEAELWTDVLIEA